MTPSQNYEVLVRDQEGCELHPYLDQAHIPTIGIGTTHYPNGTAVTLQDPPITLEQANEYLEHDSASAAAAVNAYVTSAINQNQFDALMDFTYNEGTGALHGSTLLRLVNENPADPAIRPAFMMWNKLHHDGQLVVSNDLVGRRKAEADLYFS
jgi:lysozyme